MNPNDQVHRDRLRRQIEHSRIQLAPFRKSRRKLIQHYVGSDYGTLQADEGGRPEGFETVVNLLFSAIDTYTMRIAANRPRILFVARHPERKAFAQQFQVVTNNALKQLKVEKVLRMMVLEAYLGLGIVKVGSAAGEEVEIVPGFPQITQVPFAKNVSLDRWVHDCTAEEYGEADFAGDMYRLPFDFVKESGLFDKKALEKISPTRRSPYVEHGDEKVSALSQGIEGGSDDYEDYIELWDIWLRRENLVVTIPAEGEMVPLRIVEWDGLDSGPYTLLGYSEVPDNVMPTAPGAQLRHLDELFNSMVRKLRNQANRQKTITGYREGAAQDARAVRDAADGTMVPMQNPSDVAEFSFGGADQGSQGFAIWVDALFDRQAGNLSAIAGLGSAAETLGQEQLINANASQTLVKMQERAVAAAEEICIALGLRFWNDPVRMLEGEMEIPNTSLSLRVELSPEDRVGEFSDYDFIVEPYSMQHQTPQQRAGLIEGILTRLVMPLAPMLMEQGAVIDAQEILDTLAEYLNLPELKSVVRYEPTEQRPGPSSDTPRQSPVTTRHNVRHNVPGTSRQGQAQILQQILSGGNPQQSQKAAAVRQPSY